MKTIQILISIIFININMATAGGLKTFFSNPLAPVTPIEATFSDSDGETTLIRENMTRILAPVTPAEASFDDQYIPLILSPDPAQLAPEPPKEADFSDAEAAPEDSVNLKPVTPELADFEDFI